MRKPVLKDLPPLYSGGLSPSNGPPFRRSAIPGILGLGLG